MAGATLDLVLANHPDEVTLLLSAFEDFAERNGLPHRVRMQTMLVLEELVVNIIHYAFPAGGRHPVAVHVALDEGELICDIHDEGIEFDPFRQAPAPDLSAPTLDRRVGGLGIHLVKAMVESGSYRRDERGNHIRVTKRW